MAGNLRVEINEEDRYSRLRLMPWWDQSRLARAKVMVVGAGALGNEIIKNLAMIGVGNLLVCDIDRVENSNLSRSVLYRETDAGLYGLGEAYWGWGVKDLVVNKMKPIVVGEDPLNVDKLYTKMLMESAGEEPPHELAARRARRVFTGVMAHGLPRMLSRRRVRL